MCLPAVPTRAEDPRATAVEVTRNVLLLTSKGVPSSAGHCCPLRGYFHISAATEGMSFPSHRVQATRPLPGHTRKTHQCCLLSPPPPHAMLPTTPWAAPNSLLLAPSDHGGGLCSLPPQTSHSRVCCLFFSSQLLFWSGRSTLAPSTSKWTQGGTHRGIS